MLFLIWLGKIVGLFSTLFKLGGGSTWPGHLVLKIYPKFIRRLASSSAYEFAFIAGTNGKTTTTRILTAFLSAASKKVTSNVAGANLLNGVASTLLRDCSFFGKPRSVLGVFEVDENTLPLLLGELTPRLVVILNLFRDQLDRYGELDLVAEKWSQALNRIPASTTLILNGDDPTVAQLVPSLRGNVLFFGLGDPSLFQGAPQPAADSLFCPRCGTRLSFKGVYFSHLGVWACPGCSLSAPRLDLAAKDFVSPLPGVYNRYNLAAAVLAARVLGVSEKIIKRAFADISPAFGRLEEFVVDDKKIRLLLSKNPTGFNESLRTLSSLKEKAAGALLVLNDKIPDGRDVSWIWDVDFETFINTWSWSLVSGRRAEELALRLKYAGLAPSVPSLSVKKDLRAAISSALRKTKVGGRLNILPTYSAMLEVRKLLTGKNYPS